VVTDAGAGAGSFGAGRIAVEPFYACGTCSVCTAGRYDVCRRLGFVGLPSQTAVVFGAGPIGLVTASALRATGAGQVIAVEPLWR
jgi:(R,R)-butanediol dehydrogenase/meso-butanediol dehydrogenase/diacetyl reductase